MNRHPVSGTLGTLQLLVFANAACTQPATQAGNELGFTQLRVETGDVTNATEFLSQQPSPEILLVEIGNQDQAPAQLDALANVVNPHTKVIATGKVDSIRFFQWLSDLGIDGYLLQPFSAQELKQAIAKGAIRKAEAAANKPAEQKTLIAVIGARGGVGTTTIATNLAAIFAKDLRLPTALTDLDPHFGSAALLLDLMPSKGMREALDKPDRVDTLFLERVMLKPFANLSILSAEEPISETIIPQANAGEMIVGALREKFRVIIADVPRQMNALTRHVIAQADHVLMVADPQLACLRDCLRFRDYLVEQLKRPAPRVLLNRVGQSKPNELSKQEFAKHYGHAVALELAFAHEAMTANAEGTLWEEKPKLSAQLQALRTLAKEFAVAEAPAVAGAKKSSSMLVRMMGKK